MTAPRDATWSKIATSVLRTIACARCAIAATSARRVPWPTASNTHAARSWSLSDADMQYDPNDILRLIRKLEEGYDVVSAYKVIRRDPLSKRIPSKFFNFFVRSTTGVQLHDMNAGLKAFSYQAAEDLIRFGYGELHRFFIVLSARRGYRVAEVPVESLYRTNGSSKYGVERYCAGRWTS